MEFEAMCEEMLGKRVRVTLKEAADPIDGKVIGYTRAIDNDPEIAEIYIDTGTKNSCYGLLESEILSMEELKN